MQVGSIQGEWIPFLLEPRVSTPNSKRLPGSTAIRSIQTDFSPGPDFRFEFHLSPLLSR